MPVVVSPYPPPLIAATMGGGASGMQTINGIAPNGTGNFLIQSDNLLQSNITNGIKLNSVFPSFVVDATPSIQMIPNMAYVTTDSSVVTLTLPATGALNDVVGVISSGGAGFIINHPLVVPFPSQINLASGSDTSGAAGFIQSAPLEYAILYLLCIGQVAGVTNWYQMLASQGNFTRS